MRRSLQLAMLVTLTVFLAQSVSGYDPSQHQKSTEGKSKHGGGGKGHHGYGRPKGPPADIPTHIKERTSPDGRKINLNNSLVGIKGMAIMAESPELKNIVSMALKGNKLGDEGVRILTQSSTFKHLEYLSLWDNGVSARGAQMLARGANFSKLKELNLMKNQLGSDGAVLLADSFNAVNLTSLDLSSNQIGNRVPSPSPPHLTCPTLKVLTCLTTKSGLTDSRRCFSPRR